MPVNDDGVFDPRTPLTAAEQTVRWADVNAFILQQRQRIQQQMGPLAQRIGMMAAQGIPVDNLIAEYNKKFAAMIADTWEFGYHSAQREIGELRAKNESQTTTVLAALPEIPGVHPLRTEPKLKPGRTLRSKPFSHVAVSDALQADEYRQLVENQEPTLGEEIKEYAIGEAEDKVVEAASAALRQSNASTLDHVGQALNAGRAQGAAGAAGGPPKYAMRSEQLDKNTCDPCSQYHGTIVQIDSTEFYQLLPPAFCFGGGRCRGVMVFGDGISDLRISPEDKADAEQPQEVRDIAAAKIAEAQNVEAGITSDLQSVAAKDRGKMLGLDHRLKTEGSMARKIASDARDLGRSYQEAADAINDALRFTVQFPAKEYSKQIETMLADLEGRGYKVEKYKNFWEEGNAYAGINTQLIAPNGMKFELQFHTPRSWTLKQQVNHPWYEVWRDPTKSPATRARAAEKMVANSKAIPRPPGWEKLGDHVKPRGLFGYNDRDLAFAGRAGSELKRTGGYTLDINGHPTVVKRYISAVSKDYEYIVKDPSAFDIARYRRTYEGVVRGDKRYRFGGWFDPDSGKAYLDVSTSFDNLEDALRFAGQHGQIAIYDFKSGKDIKVPAKYLRRPKRRR